MLWGQVGATGTKSTVFSSGTVLSTAVILSSVKYSAHALDFPKTGLVPLNAAGNDCVKY
jgi:hypothetical protein